MVPAFLLQLVLLAQTAPASRPSESAVPEGVQGMGWTLPALRDGDAKRRCGRVYAATQKLGRHLLARVHPWNEDESLLLATKSAADEASVRPNAGIMCGLAFLYRFGPYDERVAGLSRNRLLREKILPMIRYLTQTHVTGPRTTSDGNKWGDSSVDRGRRPLLYWQSAHWARMLGRGAWFLGPDLPEDIARDVRRVVAHEAERIAAAPPPHRVRYDTKAEENAWNSTILHTASVLMPADPRRAGWDAAFHKWALSSFLRAADEKSPQIVDGRPLSEQYTGANIYDDFTLENHGIVHPDYMTTFSLLLDCAVDYAMTGRREPDALLHNAPGLYENLKWLTLPDGGFVYPSGQDWTVFRNPDWLFPNIGMGVFARDPEAWTIVDRILEVTARMQARSETGALFLPEENTFASAESDKLYMFGVGWLALHFAPEAAPADPQRLGVRRLESAKIILNRTASAVHSVSWGATIMAQCVPYRLDRVVSPHSGNGVGFVRLAGQEKPPPITLRDARVRHSEDGFTAELDIDHGDAVRAQLVYRSSAAGAWSTHERLTALRDVDIAEVATGLIGVLNNPRWVYEDGERRVTMDRESSVVAACGGRELRAEARHVEIDSALTIESDRPLRVLYKGAAAMRRGRATDELYLNATSGERSWRAGEMISEFEATIRCK